MEEKRRGAEVSSALPQGLEKTVDTPQRENVQGENLKQTYERKKTSKDQRENIRENHVFKGLSPQQ